MALENKHKERKNKQQAIKHLLEEAAEDTRLDIEEECSMYDYNDYAYPLFDKWS